jgi:hypothetical protein
MRKRGTMRKSITMILLAGHFGFAHAQSWEEQYQQDADKVRAIHLVEWARVIEDHYKKAGRYPLQDRVEGDQIILVQIATREQQSYLDPKDQKYQRKIDNNPKDPIRAKASLRFR